MIGDKILKQEVDMNMLAITYIIGSVIGIAFLSWLYTKQKNGRKICSNTIIKRVFRSYYQHCH